MATRRLGIAVFAMSVAAALALVHGQSLPMCDPNSSIKLPDGFCALVVADGLGTARHMVPERVLATAIAECREPQRICDYLIAAANGNGGADNITVVVVEVADRWWRRLLNGWRRRPARRGEDVEAYSAV